MHFSGEILNIFWLVSILRLLPLSCLASFGAVTGGIQGPELVPLHCLLDSMQKHDIREGMVLLRHHGTATQDGQDLALGRLFSG